MNNVIITCKNSNKVLTAKFNSSGLKIWDKIFDLPLSNQEIPVKTGADQEGNIYVAGTARVNFFDFMLLKYNSEGVYQWHRLKNYSHNHGDMIAMTIDNMSNVFVTGNVAGIYKVTTIKYNSYGDELWSRLYGPNARSWVYNIEADQFGNTYVSASMALLVSKEIRGAVVKYDPSGDSVWTATMGNSLINVECTELAIAVSGNVYMTGSYSVKEMIQKFHQDQSALDLKVFFSEGFFNPGSGKTKPDLVEINLRSPTAPYQIIENISCETDTNGNCKARFLNVTDGVPFYITVTHRNSIETWSSAPVSFSGRYLSYDFSDLPSKALENNMKQVGSSPDRWAFFGGDIDQNDHVSLNDLILVINGSAEFKSGYVPEDVNGDRSVNLIDIAIVFNNSQSFITAKKL